MQNNVFLADLSTIGCSWGDKSIAIQFFQDILEKGYDLHVVADNWGNEGKGLSFDENKKEYVGKVEKNTYLFDPKVQPIDFFDNLIKFTYPGKYFFKEGSHSVEVGRKITWDFRYSEQWVEHGFKSTQKKYSLNPDFINESYKKLHEELSKTKNIIVYATWDDNMKFEKNQGRTRGIAIYPDEFKRMVTFVQQIDKFCIKNADYRLILVSKKAEDWDSVLKSDFYDLRNFETKNLCFSQLIHLLQENSFATIGTACSFAIWLSMVPDTMHYVFGYNDCSEITRISSYLDTAEKFSRDNFNIRINMKRKPSHKIRDYLRRKSTNSKSHYYLYLISNPKLLLKRINSKYINKQ